MKTTTDSVVHAAGPRLSALGTGAMPVGRRHQIACNNK